MINVESYNYRHTARYSGPLKTEMIVLLSASSFNFHRIWVLRITPSSNGSQRKFIDGS